MCLPNRADTCGHDQDPKTVIVSEFVQYPLTVGYVITAIDPLETNIVLLEILGDEIQGGRPVRENDAVNVSK